MTKEELEKENAELKAQIEKMKVCGNCVHIRECDRYEDSHIRVCEDWQYNPYCQAKPLFK